MTFGLFKQGKCKNVYTEKCKRMEDKNKIHFMITDDNNHKFNVLVIYSCIFVEPMGLIFALLFINKVYDFKTV
jgi:hypothetical protein